MCHGKLEMIAYSKLLHTRFFLFILLLTYARALRNDFCPKCNTPVIDLLRPTFFTKDNWDTCIET